MKYLLLILLVSATLMSCVPVQRITEISEKSYVVIVKTQNVLRIVEQELVGTELAMKIADDVDTVQGALFTLKRTLVMVIEMSGGSVPTLDALEGEVSPREQLKRATEDLARATSNA